MAGKHIFSSSLFIQSGTAARFQSGLVVSQAIAVDGNVKAGSFVGDGSGLTNLVSEHFFAGSGSGISGSPTPSTEDHVIILGSGQATASVGSVYIHTTHSAAFTPNHFTFIKINDTFETLQSGSQDFFIGANRTGDPADTTNVFDNDLASGVHRYLVYAADTSSNGETRFVFTTNFIKGFVNVPPEIKFDSPATLSMDHDIPSASLLVHFTESVDINANDFIREYTASRQAINFSAATSTAAAYNITMIHASGADFNSPSSTELRHASADILSTGESAIEISATDLNFTASITSFDIVNGTTVHHDSNATEQRFDIHMVDNNELNRSSSAAFTMSIAPPPTASINNIRVEFQSGSFNSESVSVYTATVLYDDTVTRDSIDELPDRYTSSLVRMRVASDIIEPIDHTQDSHLTTVRIMSSSNGSINSADKTFKYFRFRGNQVTASNYHDSDIGHSTNYTEVTESAGFIPVSFGPENSFFGVASNKLNDTEYIQHGNHNHFSATAGTNAELLVTAVPDIILTNAKIEVESGSFGSNIGVFERSASILYGSTQTFLVSETSSLENFASSSKYISASVIRLRVMATIQEPFGPHHAITTATLRSTNHASDSHTKTFQFFTGSGEANCIDSSSAYDSQHRLVSRYTSSWHAFKLDPNEFEFTSIFATTTNAALNTDAGVTNAFVTVSNTPNTIIEETVFETEGYGYSSSLATDDGVRTTSRQVLYGIPHHTLADTSSLAWSTFESASLYASHSVSRFRLRARIIEPFGPHHTASRFEKRWSMGGQSTIIDTFTADESSNSGNGIVFNGNSNDNSNTTGWSPTPTISSFAGQFDDYNSSGYFDSTQANNIIYNHGSAILIGQAKIDGESTSWQSNGVTIFGSNTNNGSDWETLVTTTDTISTTEKTLQWIPQESYQWYRFDFNVISSYFAINYIKLYTGTTSGPTSGFTDISSSILFSTQSNDVQKSSSFSDELDRLVVEYTSSWIGQQLSGSISEITNWSYTSGSIFHTPNGGSGIDTGSALTSSITVNDTPKTSIDELKIETETFGYSNNPSLSSIRTVLYGDAHTTRANSASFETHPSASTYASHSVSRFRIISKIREPFGPLVHSPTTITKTFESPAGVQSGKTETIQFITSSGLANDMFDSSSAFIETAEFVSVYTSSWVGEALDVASGHSSTRLWKISTGSVTHEPAGENGFEVVSFADSELTVRNTAQTQIEELIIETETMGESGIGIKNTSVNNTISRSILYGETATRDSGSENGGDSDITLHGFPGIYSASAVTRVRLLTKITEPVGPLHHATTIQYKGENDNPASSDSFNSANKILSSGSAAIPNTITASSEHFYDDHDRYISVYTSSFFGHQLSPSFTALGASDANSVWKFSKNSITHNPSGENTFAITSNPNLYFIVSASQPVKISNLSTEVESYPYSSSIGTSSRTEEILYGFNSTLTDSQADVIGDIWSGSAAIRFRVLTTITEPLGIKHFETNVSMSGVTTPSDQHMFALHTASAQTSSRSERTLNDNFEFVTHYTSSFYGGFTFAAGTSILSASAETSSTVTGKYITGFESTLQRNINDGIHDISDANSAQIDIIATAPATHSNTRVEVEALKSGSGIGLNERTTHILYGKFTTEGNKSTNDSYANLGSREQLVSVRILTDIHEPFGPHHAQTVFNVNEVGGNTLHQVTLHTGSADVQSKVQELYQTHGSQSVSYTSSFVPITLDPIPLGFNIYSTTFDLLQQVADPEITSSIQSHGFGTIVPVSTKTGGPTGSALITIKRDLNSGSANFTDIPSVIVSAVTESTALNVSHSTDLPIYVTNDGASINFRISSSVSASAPVTTSITPLVFPTHLNVHYNKVAGDPQFTSPQSGVSITGDDSTGGEDIAILNLATSFLNGLTNVEKININVSASSIVSSYNRAITSSVSTLTLAVVPAKPQSMHGKYWTTDSTAYNGSNGNDPGDHRIVSDTNGGIKLGSAFSSRLYKATLPAGLTVYDAGDAAGSNVDNIYMAKDSISGPVNYSMSFHMKENFSDGVHGVTDTSFDHGDSGSLIIKINGATVVNASLQSNFASNAKAGDQDLSGYDAGGFSNGTASFGSPHADKGRLIIERVSPFNEVSQSISHHDRFYPNGYQAWKARIEIDNKLNDGYNRLEFSHSIDATVTQSWQPFEWYYDDGINGNPMIVSESLSGQSIKFDYTPLSATAGQPTFSLSGVSFFNKNSPFLINFNNRINNIAHNTLRSQISGQRSLIRTSHGHSSLIQMSTGSQTVVTQMDHNLNSIANAQGLAFGGSDVGPLTLSSTDTASIKNIKINATSVSNLDEGRVYSVTVAPYVRDFTDEADFDLNTGADVLLPIGRFIDTGSITGRRDSTSQTEDFYYEDFRWNRTSFEDAEVTETQRANYQDLFDTNNADFISTTDISSSSDLQLEYTGKLIYPSRSYTDDVSEADGDLISVVNPNAPNYSGNVTGSGDRYFYRSFFVGTTLPNTNIFVRIFTPTEGTAGNLVPHSLYGIRTRVQNPGFEDMRILNADALDTDARNVRIDFKQPGPVASDSGDPQFGSANPGTTWFNICKQKVGNPQMGSAQSEGFGNYTSFSWDSERGCYTIKYVMHNGWDTSFVQGTALCRIRFRDHESGKTQTGADDPTWHGRYITSMSVHNNTAGMP